MRRHVGCHDRKLGAGTVSYEIAPSHENGSRVEGHWYITLGGYSYCYYRTQREALDTLRRMLEKS